MVDSTGSAREPAAPTPGPAGSSAVRRGRLAAAAGLVAVALVAGGVGIHILGRPAEVSAPDVGSVPVAATQQDPVRTPATPVPARTAAPATKLQAPQPGAPSTLRIAGVTAPVVATGVRPDGELEIPESPSVVGWWAGSAPVGSPANSTVIAGHVDSASSGVGAFAVLRTVDVGTTVDVVDVFRTHHHYKVVARRTYLKHDLPADEVFRVKGPARLVLITCGGPFDESTRTYKDNVVVYAVPVS